MNLGEVFDGQVRDLTSQGQGVVAHPSGATVFAAGIWLDEHVRLKITGKKGRVGFAQLEAILTPSPYRKQAECPHQGIGATQCGACPWMNIQYPAQALAKQKRVHQSLSRIVSDTCIKPIIPSPELWRWRNRAQFKTDGKKLGYVAAQSNQLVAISQCPILTDKNQGTLNELLSCLPNLEWMPSRKERWTTIDINHSDISVNGRLPFQQANEAQNAAMQTWLLTKLRAIDKKDKVLELFCGSGNFTQMIAESGVPQIVAVEGVEAAVRQLIEQDIAGLSVLQCDLFSASSLTTLFRDHRDADILILDPPRDGLKEKSGIFDTSNTFQHVIYISCDLATFTRDASAFVNNGFTLREVQPLDQFPHTPHIEVLSHFERDE